MKRKKNIKKTKHSNKKKPKQQQKKNIKNNCCFFLRSLGGTNAGYNFIYPFKGYTRILIFRNFTTYNRRHRNP